jgi:arylsulfatase A-like enzyme
MHPRIVVAAVVIACVIGGACSSGDDDSSSGAEANASPDRPNIVLVVSDDQRFDSMDQMPMLGARDDWARFERAYVELPQCCPSRATILTGRSSMHTGVDTLKNGANLDESTTIATMLHDAGYHTGFFGKYLNGYPFAGGHPVPPGWDEFRAYEGPNDYYDFRLNVNGKIARFGHDPRDYSTDVFTAQARKFVDSVPADEPFFVDLAYNAPHFSAQTNQAIPGPKDEDACADVDFPLPPNFNADDTVGEPPWMDTPAPGPDAEDIDGAKRNTCRALRGLDRSLSGLLDTLERNGRLDNTYVIYISDNGYSFGEHRLVGKGHLYEESVHVPLWVRGPDVQPGTIDRLTSNIDLVPTMLEWSGATAPDGFVDGQSFAGTLAGKASATEPDVILLRGCRTFRPVYGGGRGDEDSADAPECGGYGQDMGKNWGLRTAEYKYVENADGYVQLFDLRTDPWELTNLGPDPAHADVVAQLHATLQELQGG